MGLKEDKTVICDNCGKAVANLIFLPDKDDLEIIFINVSKSTHHLKTRENKLEIIKAFYKIDLIALDKLLGNNALGFICYHCKKHYCSECWTNCYDIYDEGYYDYTLGTCPNGHECIILD